VTLKAYHDQPNFAPAAWVTQQMASPDYPSLQWQLVAQLLYYSDPARCQYVHLVDGGISDNLGVTPLLLQRQQEANDLSIGQMIDREHVRHVAVIMVNAANRPDKDWTMRAHPPGAVAILNKAISGLMTNSTVAASRDLRLRAVTASADRPDVDFALIEIGFDNLPSEAERSFFENVATTLALSTETYDRLIQVGSRLLAENPEYQRFVAGLGGTTLSSEPSQR
jgi:NTE family protein